MKALKTAVFIAIFALLAKVTSAQTANEPVPSGFNPQSITKADSLVISFMKKYNVPGLSLAYSKNDTLKLQRCYGYADTAAHQLMTPANRFRIASISKTFTGTAVMKLIEQGKLHLNDKVFGKGAVLGTKYGTYPYKKWVSEITVEDLLEHLGGGWGNQGDDPMFLHPELNQAQLISWTLDNQPLRHKPGSNFEYSNFGFCLLGRVIEKISGVKYEDYVRKNILIPSGITSMEVGGNTLAERKPNEVYYYDKQEDPYTMDERRMDSHGGWIATPTDLIKFMAGVEPFTKASLILKPATLDTMFTAPSVNPGYAKGWAVTKTHTHWHNGSLPGQQSIMARINAGLCWAVMVNTRADSDFGADLDELMWNIKAAIKKF